MLVTEHSARRSFQMTAIKDVLAFVWLCVPVGKPAGVLARAAAATQAWMMRVIQQHGFLGILLLASWPNAAFDLCGICCGAFLMPFWEFFGATLIGKGLVKVSGQSMFFVSLFGEIQSTAMFSSCVHLKSCIVTAAKPAGCTV